MNEGVRKNEEEGLRQLLWCWSVCWKEKRKRREWELMGTKAWGKVAGEGSGREGKSGEGLQLHMGAGGCTPLEQESKIRVFVSRVFLRGCIFFFFLSLLVATTSLFIEIFHGQKFKIIPQLARLFQTGP